jgi:hypothetical protein
MVEDMMSAAQNKIHKLKPLPMEFINTEEMEVPEFDVIDKKCMQEQGIFVDIEGRILPCCMFYSASTFASEKPHFEKIMYSKEKNWNSLHHHSMDTILAHSFWDNFIESFDTAPNKLCIINCGKCAGEKAAYDVDLTQEEF